MNQFIDIHPKVLDALRSGKPVVALESTVIAHGMPYPKNVETALNVEKIVEQSGATPATIAIIDGRIKVGLNPNELTTLGKQSNVLKVSKRDIPYCVIKKYSGATTVSATILIADMVGIKVFATGGIGGVHKHADELTEKERVICVDISDVHQYVIDLLDKKADKSQLDLLIQTALCWEETLEEMQNDSSNTRAGLIYNIAHVSREILIETKELVKY